MFETFFGENQFLRKKLSQGILTKKKLEPANTLISLETLQNISHEINVSTNFYLIAGGVE